MSPQQFFYFCLCCVSTVLIARFSRLLFADERWCDRSIVLVLIASFLVTNLLIAILKNECKKTHITNANATFQRSLNLLRPLY